MAASVKRSTDTARVWDRHGERGMVVVRAEVRPAVKDSLIDIAEFRDSTLKAIVTEALERYIVAATPKPRHWGLLRHRRRA